ncbi:exostosin-3 [Planococcus citri]|uniref:exostosin-3 n=1 Tax=Planococcus citri TaxID=170843 RepID=UPI0031F97E63
MKHSSNSNSLIMGWIMSIKLSKVIGLVFLVLISVSVLIHYFLSRVEKDVQYIHYSRSTLDVSEDFTALSASKLKFRIQDMMRIKGSVLNEIRNLESKRQKLQKEILACHQRKEQCNLEVTKLQTESNKLKISVQQAHLSHLEAVQRNSPELAPPIPILSNELPKIRTAVSEIPLCYKMRSCFDYSRCSLTSGFPVYLYDPEIYFPSWQISSYLKTMIRLNINFNPHVTNNSRNACVFVILIGETDQPDAKLLSKLPFWGGDGRNHIVINLSRSLYSSSNRIAPSLETGKAILVQSTWNVDEYRIFHDIVIPPILGPPGGEVWMDSPYMLPARRKYLLSFQGVLDAKNESVNDDYDISRLRNIRQHLTSKTTDEFYMDFDCALAEQHKNSTSEEWLLCRSERDRAAILKESTFALIPCAIKTNVLSTATFLTRLFESLKHGTIPLILGSDYVTLPFSEVIDWKKAVLPLPLARMPECHWLMRSIPDNDLLLMKRQGRLLYEKYFATGQNVLDTVIAVVRNRLLIPPSAILDAPNPSVFPDNFTVSKMDPPAPESEPEENLGPLEPPSSSMKFMRNYSSMLTQNYEIWNTWVDPFHLYPNLPFDPLLPSDAKFIGSEIGFRAINSGAGGAGKEFCESLGGNVQKEQFTIVILTYEREQVLMNSLNRLHGLPYLNKVIVVWNSPTPPSSDFRLPDIGIPIQFVQARKNSLNNRFLPYAAIETEAVLSVDDDAHLRHDEIIFGFRVWREERDRIVGFPGRYHALDLNHGGWLYNSNYSCELSMVLTGAAFFHRHYLYLYTYSLPQAIRDMVDEYMNCEDIAMNFLVSHLTRKPPVKVTSRWTFRCPGCPVSLSEDETHFNERHKCINFFTKVFGYTPLLYTQFRADSILFKTRIPHDKQKCFKYI